MNISLANSDQEIASCHAVMRELRPHIEEKSFVSRVRSQQKYGYMLAYVQEAPVPVAVAGFRIAQSLSWGRFLYVDDLVTLPGHRSRGYGAALLAWLADFAAEQDCQQLHLDSGIQRKDAHRFYEREGMELIGYHFRKAVAPKAAPG